jgi:hypothetical protein
MLFGFPFRNKSNKRSNIAPNRVPKRRESNLNSFLLYYANEFCERAEEMSAGLTDYVICITTLKSLLISLRGFIA